MRIVKSLSDDWKCFWAWPSLYATQNKDRNYALLLAWLWWILVIREWEDNNADAPEPNKTEKQE